MVYGYFYRLIMKVAHKYNWHYAPPLYPDGATQLWCEWCGFRQTIKRGPKQIYTGDGQQNNEALLPKKAQHQTQITGGWKRLHRKYRAYKASKYTIARWQRVGNQNNRKD